MANFFARAAEVQVLEREHRAARGAFVPVYGRRRVGKTELIRRFLARKPGAIYVAGQRVTAKLGLSDLLRVAAEVLGVPLLARMTPDGWRDALLAIEGEW